MQITKINTAVPKKLTNKGSGSNKNNIDNRKQQTQSFKGIGVGLDKFALATANLIENGGLFVSFTLQDMLGTNLPRPIMGLLRNSKENDGKKNTKFAAKELVREMLTGPSMFLIPMGLLGVGKKVVGKTVEVPMAFLKDLGKIHAENPVNALGEKITKQDFYQNAFSEMIKRLKSEDNVTDETLSKATEFAKKLVDKGTGKKVITELADDFVDIAKQHASDPVNTDFTRAMFESASGSFKDAISHIVSYADDTVEKVAKKNVENIPEYVKKLTNVNIVKRFATNSIMYAAVLAFLQVIPRLYNKAEGKENAGLTGLMKEETLENSQIATAKKQSTSNPSFGSLAGVAGKLTGSGVVGKFGKMMEFEGFNVSFPQLAAIMGFGVLTPRLIQAKDKYDREEILRRDLVTCATMLAGEKILRKAFSKLNETKEGLVLATKTKGHFDKNLLGRVLQYLNPIGGAQVMSTDQIVSKYSGIDKYKNGIAGFCDFIDGQGGNLAKVFSVTDESKSIVSNLLRAAGKEMDSIDNATVREVLSSAADSDDVKKLIDLFKSKDNAWVQKAKTLNARFTALSVLVLVPVFLGFMLPAINERATKKRVREEQAAIALEQQKSNQNMSNNFFEQNHKMNNIFDEVANFK